MPLPALSATMARRKLPMGKYQHDEVFCYLSTPWGEYEKILTGFTGRVVEICAQQGATVRKGDVIGYILRSDIFA